MCAHDIAIHYYGTFIPSTQSDEQPHSVCPGLCYMGVDKSGPRSQGPYEARLVTTLILWMRKLKAQRSKATFGR